MWCKYQLGQKPGERFTIGYEQYMDTVREKGRDWNSSHVTGNGVSGYRDKDSSNGIETTSLLFPNIEQDNNYPTFERRSNHTYDYQPKIATYTYVQTNTIWTISCHGCILLEVWKQEQMEVENRCLSKHSTHDESPIPLDYLVLWKIPNIVWNTKKG